MTGKFKLLSGACLAAVLALTACEPAEVSQPDYDFIHEVSDIAVDESVTYGKLDNGLRYAVMKNDTPTNSASIRLWFGTGSLNETDETQGLAHFLEHMAFNGSTNMPEGEMTKTLERYGLAFGADTNAYTSFDETVYMLELPDTSDEMFDVTLGIMRETAENLTLAPEAIDRERGVVISEKRRRNSPAWRAQMASLDFYLGETRIPSRIPIGEVEDMESVSQADFRAFYDGYYRPENAFIVIVGDAEPEKMVAEIEEHFGGWQARGEALAFNDAGTVGPHDVKVGYFSDPAVPTSVSLSVMMPFTPKADTAEQRREDVIASIGDSIFNRRLTTLARAEDAVFHSGGASQFGLYEAADMATLTLSTSPENWDEALAVGEQEMRKAVAYGFTESELDEQIANYRKSLQVGVQTAGTRQTPSLAMGIVGSFSGDRVFSTPQDGLKRFESYADDITVEEVSKSFADRWSAIETPLIYVNHAEGIDAPEEAIRQAWEESRQVDVKAPEEQVAQDFAYTDFGPAGEIVSRDHVEDLDIHRVKFANNVMLNIKQTDFKEDTISIQVQIGEGFLSLPEDNMKVRHFADYAMGTGGLVAHSADDLQRLMAGRAVGVGFGTSTETFYLSGTTVPEDLETQMQLMTAFTTAPGFRPEAKSRFDKQVESWYPTINSTPGGIVSREVPRLIRSGDARFGIPSKDEYLDVSLDDVSAWLKPQLSEGLIEISIVGDVDIEKAIDIVGRTFGALPQRADSRRQFEEQRKLTFPGGTAEPITLTHEGEADRAVIRVYWPATDNGDITMSRQISMLERVFSNRLIDVIREEEGATYSPSASQYTPEVYPGYGYITVSLDLDPKDVDRMFDVVDEIAADFAAGNITQDDFDRAQKPLLEQLEESLENNDYWGGVISQAQTDPSDLDNARTRTEAFENMTLDDIKPLAAQIFDPAKAYKIKVVPKSE